ncbi:MAG: RNA polymerase subunit sigma-24 [Flavobacteriaceae bacterium]|nr:RNA polymerase subunit sigma-24 [Flavobacteriaceae bacterium]|tara:strand:- start:20673 stop:21257 length:585 start_codon:yes stop_codon:yes gene_type:complete
MNTKSPSDAHLVKKYISGEENALSDLIYRHQSRLYGFIFSKIQDRDAAEDVFQDTFIKVIRTLKLGNYNEQGKFLPWVMRIAHNLVIDYFRKNNRMPKFKNKGDFDIFSVLYDLDPNVEHQIVDSQITEHLRNLLNRLPDEQQIVIKMRIYQDMSFKEISENTGVSINTALGRMRYGLINLRKMIDKYKISLIN